MNLGKSCTKIKLNFTGAKMALTEKMKGLRSLEGSVPLF